MKKSLLSLAIATTLTITAGCGGGSSSGGSTPATTTNATLTGTAAKGIIQYGVVTAVELNANGTDGAVVGTAKTDAKGQYSLTLGDNYTGGVVRLRISAETGTKMKCDAFDGCGDGNGFGSAIDLSEGFSLDAVVQPTGSTVKAQITPLTHMAAARAVASGTVNAETVQNAISEVNSIAGVNIMENEMVDITDPTSLSSASAEAKQLALFNAGLAEVLVKGDGDLQTKLQNNIKALADSFEDGQFDNSDAVTITEITTAVKAAATDAAANSEISGALEETIDSVNTVAEVIESQTDENGEYNPEPSNNTGLSEIAQAKAMLTNARTFVEQIGTNFEQPLDALGIDAETAADVLSDDTAIMGALLGETLDQVFDDISEKTTLSAQLATPGNIVTTLTNGTNGETINGTITTTFATTGGISMTLNGSLSGSESEGVTRTVNFTNLKIATNLTPADLKTNGNLLEEISGNDVQLTLSGSVGNDDTSLELTNVALNITTTGFTADLTDSAPDSQDETLEAALTSASFDGEMTIKSNGATFNGDVEIKLVDLDNNVSTENPLSLQKIAVDGGFSSAKGSFSAGASLIIDNANSIDTFAFFDDSIDETTNSFIQGTLTLSTTATVPDLPEASVVTSLSRANIAGGNANITVSYNGQSFKLDAASTDLDADEPEGTLTLTNPDGVKLIVNLKETKDGDTYVVGGTVFVNETQIATISETDSGVVLVRYNDGTFESLF